MASTKLTKTFSGASNRKTMTFSFWVKRGKISSGCYLANAGAGGSPEAGIEFNGDDTFSTWQSSGMSMRPTRKFRDPSAWYHIVVAIDTTQSTASDRCKIYVNGVQETSFVTETYPSQNDDLSWNSTATHVIGAYYSNSNYFDGIMSHFHFIDGTAYAASDFGETDSTTGEWKIKASPSVTYGTNGFFILKNGNSVTDQSGNSNNFTATGNLTNTEDCPSDNFATLNPLYNPTGGPELTNGLTTVTGYDSGKFYFASTLGVTKGKWYSEYKIQATQTSATIHLGISSNPEKNSYHNYFPGEDTRSYSWGEFGSTWYNGTGTAQGTTFTTGDIVGIALDVDNSKLYFSKNGSWISIGGVTGVPTSGATGTGAISINSADANDGNGFWHFAIGDNSGTYGSDNVINCNFGNGYFGTTAISSEGTNASGIGKFEYDVPTGYTALSTKGLNE
jgi:hypothetical protein